MNNTSLKAAPSERLSSGSSAKLLQILEAISASSAPVRLQDLAKQVNMTQPTVLRYLNALVDSNYVYQDEFTLRYALTWKICGLGQFLNNYSSLRSIAWPYLNQLASDTGLGACLVAVNQANQYEGMYLDCIDNPRRLDQALRRIGRSAPLYTTASGKLFLASYSDDKIDEYIRTYGLSALTEKTLVTREALFDAIERTRRTGMGLDNEECELGVRCMSLPLRDFTSRVVAAVSIFGPVTEMTDEFINNQAHPLLLEITECISQRMGYDKDKA